MHCDGGVFVAVWNYAVAMMVLFAVLPLAHHTGGLCTGNWLLHFLLQNMITKRIGAWPNQAHWCLSHVSNSIRSKDIGKSDVYVVSSSCDLGWPFRGSLVQSCTRVINNSLIRHDSEVGIWTGQMRFSGSRCFCHWLIMRRPKKMAWPEVNARRKPLLYYVLNKTFFTKFFSWDWS